ncbi:MAG: sulfotransferase [Deltaproteobacteria bacterium]|nr:sulfotransferase [Deltaproteobacteria bacterium]
MGNGIYRFIHPMVGSSTANILASCRGRRISARFYPKLALTVFISSVLAPFRWYERLRFDKAIREYDVPRDPVFIIGHWRSGTTYLHNILCQDPRFSYITTYQSIFPEYLLGSKRLLQPLMNLIIPKNRPMDEMKLQAEFPQEDEFALGNSSPFSMYHYLIFPEDLDEYYKKSVAFEGMPAKHKNRWKNNYLKLVKKALFDQKRDRFISKNPAHTGRIATLLEMFPSAKFIHIFRNPVTVFLSTKRYLDKSMAQLRLTDFDHGELDAHVSRVYREVMNDFLHDQALIPPQNYFELRYEDFAHNPHCTLRDLYEKLDLGEYDQVSTLFSEYIESQRSYKKNTHQVSRSQLEYILNELRFALDKWGYDVPTDIQINDELVSGRSSSIGLGSSRLSCTEPPSV